MIDALCAYLVAAWRLLGVVGVWGFAALCVLSMLGAAFARPGEGCDAAAEDEPDPEDAP